MPQEASRAPNSPKLNRTHLVLAVTPGTVAKSKKPRSHKPEAQPSPAPKPANPGLFAEVHDIPWIQKLVCKMSLNTTIRTSHSCGMHYTQSTPWLLFLCAWQGHVSVSASYRLAFVLAFKQGLDAGLCLDLFLSAFLLHEQESQAQCPKNLSVAGRLIRNNLREHLSS